MSAKLRCLNCGVTFAPFGGPEAAVRAFSAHPCAKAATEQATRATYPGMGALAARARHLNPTELA